MGRTRTGCQRLSTPSLLMAVLQHPRSETFQTPHISLACPRLIMLCQRVLCFQMHTWCTCGPTQPQQHLNWCCLFQVAGLAMGGSWSDHRADTLCKEQAQQGFRREQ